MDKEYICVRSDGHHAFTLGTIYTRSNAGIIDDEGFHWRHIIHNFCDGSHRQLELMELES